jgi:hypothetical protein
MDRSTPLDRRHPLREYIVIVGRLWGREISGPILAGVSIVLAIAYACYADNANATVSLVKYAAWLTGAISILLVFIAQYKAWLAEREKFEAEEAKNQRPEILGHASNFMTEGPLLNSMSDGAKSAAFTLKFDMNLCNHRQVPTNLQDITVTGTIYGHISHFSEVKFDHANLLYGIAANLQVTGRANVYSLDLEDLKGKWLNLDNIRIYAVDGFGDRHQIGMREGEEILVL